MMMVISSFGQVVQGTDVSKIVIDELSDEQIVQLINRMNLSGQSESELERKALEAGFTETQVSRLKERIASIKEKQGDNKKNNNQNNTKDDGNDRNNRSENRNSSNTNVGSQRKNKVFGSEFFSSQNITFEPNLKIATPSNYILGPGDKVNLDIFGYSDVQYKLEISADGFIRIPNVGPVYVSGLSFEEARVKVKNQLATVFSGIKTGNTSFQMSLGEVRSIRVTIIGEVTTPGSYTVPSLATIANALYLSGGPSLNGSFRKIDLVRNGKTATTFDFYDFLLRGDLSKNLLLRDQDVIRVHAYETRMELTGAVKRQAIFEVKNNETLKDVINYAGGFADTANKELVTIYRISGSEREIVTVPFAKLDSYSITTGDSVVVNGVTKRFKNRVSVNGAVSYPGNYSLLQAPTVKDLLESAHLLENAFRGHAVIRRLTEDYVPSIIDFNVSDALSGKNNPALIREDSLYIFYQNDLHEQYNVVVNGAVNKPGVYDFAPGMKLQNLLLMAGGFSDGASSKRVEIARRIRTAENGSTIDSGNYAIVKVVDLGKNYSELNSEAADYQLQSFDVVSVRKAPSYKEQINVKVEGEVYYPGTYTIQSRTERLSDLIRRAGGLKAEGFAEGALLKRNTFENKKDSVAERSKLDLFGKQSKDTSLRNDEQKPVGIRLNEALAVPGSLYDIYLEEGDILKIPKKLQTVQTFGAVNVAQKIVYRPGMNLHDAVEESGGFAIGAIRGRSYVIHANGEVSGTHRFLFFKTYPKLRPGTEIYVPTRGPRKPMTAAELVGISTSIVGLGVLLLTLKNTL